MMLNIHQANQAELLTSPLPLIFAQSLEQNREFYEENRHRVYAIAFWMTDNELLAEDVMIAAFSRALRDEANPTSQDLDRALVSELARLMPLGSFTLDCTPANAVKSVRYNVLRVDLERALVQLPNTEKLIFVLHDVESYDGRRIANLLNLTEDQIRLGLHQARLYLRQLLSN